MLDSNNVVMYSNDGNLITTSKKQRVELECSPWGLTYGPHESAVIVADWKQRLTFLDPCDLHLIRRIQLNCLSGVRSVGVLSDGRLVVRTAKCIDIYDRRGRHITSSQIFVANNEQVSYLNFIGVLPGDIIVVNMLSNNRVLFLTPHTGKWLMHEFPLNDPINLSVNLEGYVLLVDYHNVLCLSGPVGNIKKHILLHFNDDVTYDVGPPFAVAMQGRQLVVLWEFRLSLYQLE